MTNIVILLLAFVVAISVLVAVHEFGHYWVARRLGIKVLRFSIGFGRPVWSRKAGADQTEYVISALPLGGYVKMLDEREGPVPDQDRARAFNNAPIASRLAVLAAGPAFNFLFAIAVYWVIFMMGVTEMRPVIGDIEADSYAAAAGLVAGDEIVAANGEATVTWQEAQLAIIDDLVDDGKVVLTVADTDGIQREVRFDVGADKRRLTEPGQFLEGLGIFVWPRTQPAVIGSIVAGGAAAAAGVEAGDRIVAIDDIAIDGWASLVEYLEANPQRAVNLAIERNGQRVDLPLVIGEARVNGVTVGRLGVTAQVVGDDRSVEVRRGPLAAAAKAVSQTGEMTAFTVRMLWRMLTGDFSARNLSGPLTIAEYAGESARIGPGAFLSFLAVVSISLGILNLLPVPILDGGQIMFQLAEAFKGSPLSPETELRGQQVGVLLLLMLMSLAFYNDIVRLIG